MSMGYDIPDEIKYKEKIVANLDLKQLGYAILFGMIAFFSYKIVPLSGEFKLITPSIFIIIGICFVFFGFEQKALDYLSYFIGIRKTGSRSKIAQKFFGIKEVKDNLIWLDDKAKIGMFKVQPINLNLLDSARRKVVLANYKAFLNQLSMPIQVLIKTTAVDLQNYFEKIETKSIRNGMTSTYSDFRMFEENFVSDKGVKKREYFLIARFRSDQSLDETSGKLSIIEESITACGLGINRLCDSELTDFLMDYGGEHQELGKAESKDEFKNMITPSLEFHPSYGIVNGELHQIVKVIGYPRKVDDGWLQSFLCKNEDYDISMHIQPASINHTLVYLHNQVIQQTSDLIMSTAKGTPNPSLEIKRADTMRIYEMLYKGEEKMFRVSIYIDNKAEDLKSLGLLAEKCVSNLNAQLMVPEKANWRTADSIKSTLPIADDKLGKNREILTSALTATFPFISPSNSNQNGVLFAHELETRNPIFLDLENQSNKHFFIIGISGSGKSYAAKYLAIQQLFKEDSKMYVLDPNGEYKGICNALGGDVIEISKESKSIINLFDLCGDDFGGKLLQLVSAFDIIMGGLNESQKAILSDAVSSMYASKGIEADDESTWENTPPKFSDLKETLEKMRKEFGTSSPQARSLEALYRRIKMYCKGGVFGFLDQDTKIRSENPVLCFDLSRLPSAVKPLMIFVVLGFIQRQISKDREAKTVLIDEGWVLLRSKEAEQYVLEFVKTSRKFNASIGFITQEVEDLLRSDAGRSILNTASVKILMRLNASSINLVSSNLRLNEYEENYLLSARKGQGLVLTEDNAYCFHIQASPKIHELITTNPNEEMKTRKEKIKEKIKIDAEKGLYETSKITDAQKTELMKKGHVIYKTKFTNNGKYIFYLVKIRSNESAEHSFLCWFTFNRLLEFGLKPKMNVGVGSDIQFNFRNKRICFEVETGKRLNYMKREEMFARFLQREKEFDSVYLIVPNERIVRRYYGLCKNILTKSELESALSSLFSSPH